MPRNIAISMITIPALSLYLSPLLSRAQRNFELVQKDGRNGDYYIYPGDSEVYSGRAYLDLRGIFTSRGTLVFTFTFIYHADEERRPSFARARRDFVVYVARATAAPDPDALEFLGIISKPLFGISGPQGPGFLRRNHNRVRSEK